MDVTKRRQSVICHTNDYNISKYVEKHSDGRKSPAIRLPKNNNTTKTLINDEQQYRHVTHAGKNESIYQKNENKDSGFEDVYEEEDDEDMLMPSSPIRKTFSNAFSNPGEIQPSVTSSSNALNLPINEKVGDKLFYPKMPTLLRAGKYLQKSNPAESSQGTTLNDISTHSSPFNQLPKRQERKPYSSARDTTTTPARISSSAGMSFTEKYSSLSCEKVFPVHLPSSGLLSSEHFNNNLKHRFESSVFSALRDPKFRYLLTLYKFVDEGLLRKTLLKFLRAPCLDKKMSQEASKYLDQISEPLNITKEDVFTNLHTKLTTSCLTKHADDDSHSEVDVGKYDFSVTQSSASGSPLTPVTDGRFAFGEQTVDSENGKHRLYPAELPTFKHLRGDNSSNINGKCEYCQKRFNSVPALQRHLRTHEGKRTHKCSHCSRSFYDRSSYIWHMRSHSGEKKHKCDQCSMAFNKRSALEVHMRTHTGERPFVCEFCGKGFSISGNLHRHALIHTGHRPYKCGKCPRAFNNPSHLARHISSFHT